MTDPPSMLRSWKFWGLDVLVWSLFVVLSSASWSIDLARNGRPAELSEILRSSALQTTPWVLITAGVFFLVERLAQTPRRWTSRFVACTGLAVLGGLVYLPVRGLTLVAAQRKPLSELGSVLAESSLFEWFFDSLLLAAVVALALAVVTSRESRRRKQRETALELRTARLEGELDHARLQMLRAQLEPHFLHNALNAVTALVRCGRSEDAVEAIAQLSDLLRFAAEATDRERVTVGEEMAFAETYLRFQERRFGDRLAIDFDLDPALEDVEIPPLVLQPMLENAIHHGVERSEETSRVGCRGFLEDGALCLEVTNTPCWPRGSQEGLGIGLANTRRRLAAHYGERFNLAGGRQGGTYVTRLRLAP